jgi:hypothetical protein
LCIFAQEDEIVKIRERYKLINEMEEYDLMSHIVNLNYMLPAVGLKTKTLTFYYEGEQVNPEEDPYDFNYSLAKAVITWNVSASNTYTTEYLFNEYEQLIFCFEKGEGMFDNYEYRYYFKDLKMIKCIIKSTNEDGTETNYTKTSGFGKQELTTADHAKANAAKYLKTFKDLNNLNETGE